MTATTTPVAPSTTSPSTRAARPAAPVPSLWRTGLGAGLVAAAATVAVAAVAHAAGVSLETEPGQAIPAIAFGQLTLFCTAIGVFLARAMRRRAHRPRTTFTRATVGLTALSLVPDVILSAGVSTKLTLVLTHLVAAAIVIPALSSRLPD